MNKPLSDSKLFDRKREVVVNARIQLRQSILRWFKLIGILVV